VNINREVAKTIRDAFSWGLQMLYGDRPAQALEGGIPKDPDYKPKTPFFVNGISKNSPISPKVPDKILDSKPPSTLGVDGVIKSFLSSSFLGGEVLGGIDTHDGKISPKEIHDQYLEGVEGGKESLLAQTRSNYDRDKDDLPWTMDPENRNRRVSVEIREDHLGSMGAYNPLSRTAWVGEQVANGGVASDQRSKDTDWLSANGLRGTKGGISYPEVVGHEVGHAALVGGISHPLKEVGTDISPKNPYFYALSEEYKVGALTFLNKSRQLTGKKLADPQEIHQLFDEIEADPSILDKNYSNEESRLPRTYLLLKETNPQGAELLRSATARDCQYLANKGQEALEMCSKVVSLGMPDKVSPEVVAASLQVANPNLQEQERIARLNQKLSRPILEWVENISRSGLTKEKTNKDLGAFELS